MHSKRTFTATLLVLGTKRTCLKKKKKPSSREEASENSLEDNSPLSTPVDAMPFFLQLILSNPLEQLGGYPQSDVV
jgi:hypothetical protein